MHLNVDKITVKMFEEKVFSLIFIIFIQSSFSDIFFALLHHRSLGLR